MNTSRRFFLGIVLSMLCGGSLSVPSAVTYYQDGSRFGSQLLNYIHAAWVSYICKVPLLYKPFFYSNQLVLHDAAFSFDDYKALYGQKIKLIESPRQIQDITSKSGTLYVIPYFPELNMFYKTVPFHFKVDWDDHEFIEQMRRLIRPNHKLNLIYPPNNIASLAVHVRTGAGADSDFGTLDKFLIDDFYINGIKKIADELKGQALYVFIFTDHEKPEMIVSKYKTALARYPNIEIDCRRHDNGPNNNVLEDFFSMMNFDYLVRSESIMSLIVSKLKSFKKVITPDKLNYAIAKSPKAEHSFYTHLPDDT